MNAPTPKPWGLVYGNDGHHHIFAADGPIAVVSVRFDAEEQDANARLFLHASDLLDALRAFCGDYESTPTTGDTSLKAAYLHALEVIAKAEAA